MVEFAEKATENAVMIAAVAAVAGVAVVLVFGLASSKRY